MTEKFRLKSIWLMIGGSFLFCFFCASLRHWLFLSAGTDLGIFDQAVYLISQGQTPFSSFLEFHILSDHAALILYPISLLYRIYPSVHWLFAVQSLAVSLAAYPVFRLALLARLTSSQATAVSAIYLLYPVVFNACLFDFHPDVIALPAIFWMILAARSKWLAQFCVATAIVLSCKAVLSLTVAAMGLWLLLFERRRGYGAIALIAGIAWFLIATKLIIPAFSLDIESGLITRHIFRYGDLGSTYTEIAKNILTKPQLVLGKLFAPSTLEYFLLLLAPVAYLLSGIPTAIAKIPKLPSALFYLMPAIPVLAMNILSTQNSQRNLVQWYSLPIVPFIVLMVIAYFQSRTHLSEAKKRKTNKLIIGWAAIAFLSLSRLVSLVSPPYESADTFQAARTAISRVQGDDSLLTTSAFSPHLSHRKTIAFTDGEIPPEKIDQFHYVLLNTRYPGWRSSVPLATTMANYLIAHQRFQLDYQQDGVYLFVSKQAS